MQGQPVLSCRLTCPTDVSHTLIDVYKWRDFQHTTTHIFLSHSKSTSYLEDGFQPHMGRTKKTDRTAARVSAARVSQKV